jgi:hypothetical protein
VNGDKAAQRELDSEAVTGLGEDRLLEKRVSHLVLDHVDTLTAVLGQTESAQGIDDRLVAGHLRLPQGRHRHRWRQGIPG